MGERKLKGSSSSCVKSADHFEANKSTITSSSSTASWSTTLKKLFQTVKNSIKQKN